MKKNGFINRIKAGAENVISYLIILFTLNTIILGQTGLDIAYNMQLEFLSDSAAAPTVEGVNKITIVNRWDRPLSDVYLHNNCNGDFKLEDKTTARTVLGKITSRNNLTVDNSAALSVRIRLFPPLEVGDTLALNVPFSTRLAEHSSPFLPTRGSLGDTTIYNLIFFYPLLEYFYGDGWHTDRHGGMADPHTNLAEYNVSISYPPSMTIATSAHTIATDTLDDGNILIATQYPRANSFSFVLADNFDRHHANVRDVNIDLICTPGQSPNAKIIFTELDLLIPFYERLFGPCPNDKLTITMGYSLGQNTGALATTNYIIYGNDMANINILAHEFAHQWFGNAINADETFEAWLNESFAEYAARKYMHQRPASIEKRAAVPTTSGFLDFWTDIRTFSPEKLYWLMPDLIGDQALPPIYREGQALNWDNLDDITSLVADAVVIYYHGSNALLMLEASVGDSVMHQIMLKYTDQYRWRTAETNDFVRVIRELAGTDIADNFLTAISNSHRPDPRITNVDMQKSASEWITTVSTNSDGPWNLSHNLKLITVAGDTIIQPSLAFVNAQKEFKTNSKVKSIKIAPSGRIIDRNLSNNNWPRKSLFQPFMGLPNWEYYKYYLHPSIKRDWRGNMRYGITLRGILGANFMPFTPTWFSHAFKLNINYAPDNSDHKYGFKASYKRTIGGNPYRQLGLSVLDEYPKNSQIIDLTNYFAGPKFYFRGGIARFAQLKLTAGRIGYYFEEINDLWPIHEYYFGQVGFRWLQHVLISKTHLAASFLLGSNTSQTSFTSFNFDAEHSHSFPKLTTANLWVEFRSINDPEKISDQGTSFGLSQSPFSDEQGISRFRGPTDMEEIRWKNSLVWGISLGTAKPRRFSPKLVVYMDMAVADQTISGLLDGQSDLYQAIGVGLEGNSIISYGLYLPIWASNPPHQEPQTKFRIMGQLRLNW